jgi:hypothetical protein
MSYNPQFDQFGLLIKAAVWVAILLLAAYLLMRR